MHATNFCFSHSFHIYVSASDIFYRRHCWINHDRYWYLVVGIKIKGKNMIILNEELFYSEEFQAWCEDFNAQNRQWLADEANRIEKRDEFLFKSVDTGEE